MKCGFAALLAMFALGAANVEAAPLEVSQAMPGAMLVGQARYSFVSLPMFDAALWSRDGAFAWDRPFALSLTYRRAFTAEALAERTLSEMEARGDAPGASLEPLRARLFACYVDVAAGDRITAVSQGANRAAIFFNGVQQCTLEWTDLRRTFFGIWLDGRGGSRAFSERLRGAR